MRTTAAILVETNQPLQIEEIQIPPLQEGQVLVEITYSGICRTQLLEALGKKGKDPYLPHLLGHEGSGVILEVGKNVRKVKPEDKVILSWMKGSGANVSGTIYEWKGKKVNAGAVTTFSKHAIVSENRLCPIPVDFPLLKASFLGCAIPTGLGSIFNTLQAKAMQSIAIFGCGGIGLFALQGAVISSCQPIVAIDISDSKLEHAKKLGATHCINSLKEDPLQVLAKIGPIDYAVEASGNADAMQQALQCVRPQGGSAVIIGNAHHGCSLSLDPKEFNMGKKLFGTWGGDNIPDYHFPKYCHLVTNNSLELTPFLGKHYSLENIQKAMTDLQEGKCVRPIIDMSL